MFDNKSRQQLEAMRSTLRNFGQSVPERAKGFHRLRSLLADDIDQELRRFFPRKTIVEGYLQRYEPLARVAAELGGLLRQSQMLEGELEGLQALFAKERQTSDYGDLCCRQWREELRKLPALCEREADLTAAKRELEQIGLSIRLHGEALRVFQEADAIIKGLGNTPETAGLEAELSQLRQAMVAGRVSLEGIRQIKKLCVPLDALLKQPTPQELQSLSAVLTEIRLWNSALAASTEQERSLEQRRRQLGTDWRRRDPEASKTLLDEAEALRKQRIRQGSALRDQMRRDLEELLDDLARACGPQPDIRLHLDALKQGGFDSANRHKDWMERFNEADALFKDTAKNHELALEQRLRERRADLDAQWRALRALPIAEALRRQAEELERHSEALAFPQETEDFLKALRLGNEISRQIDGLAEQARLDRLQLDADQRGLHEANARLRQEAARLGYAVEPLPPGVAVLGESVSGLDLDQAREWVETQSARLAVQQQDFLGHCQNLRQQRQADIDRHGQALQAAGFPASNSQFDGICPDVGRISEAHPASKPDSAVANLPFEPAPDDPGAWADWLLEQERECQRLEESVGQALEQLARRCADFRKSLLDLGEDTLLPGECEEVQGLLDGLAACAEDASPPAERLRTWAAAAQACGGLLERLSAERQGWQAQLDALKQGLQALVQERLKAYCPEELFNRASDLAYGIPSPPQGIHLAQLREARRLFDCLERHALRRAAHTVEGQMAALERCGHPRPPDVEALLQGIRELGDEKPVPADVRQRLQNAVAALGVVV